MNERQDNPGSRDIVVNARGPIAASSSPSSSLERYAPGWLISEYAYRDTREFYSEVRSQIIPGGPEQERLRLHLTSADTLVGGREGGQYPIYIGSCPFRTRLDLDSNGLCAAMVNVRFRFVAQVGLLGYATGGFVGRLAVYAGRVVRCDDRRLDNAKRSPAGPARDVLAIGRGVGPHGCCTMRGTGVRNQFHRRPLLLSHHHGGSGEEREALFKEEQVSRFPAVRSRILRASFASPFPGVHIRDLDAGNPRMSVGDAEGAGPRRRLAVLHSRYVPELAAKRAAGRRRAVDALPGDPLHTGNPIVPGAERQGRRGRQQSSVATRRPGRHTARATGNSPTLVGNSCGRQLDRAVVPDDSCLTSLALVSSLFGNQTMRAL